MDSFPPQHITLPKMKTLVSSTSSKKVHGREKRVGRKGRVEGRWRWGGSEQQWKRKGGRCGGERSVEHRGCRWEADN